VLGLYLAAHPQKFFGKLIGGVEEKKLCWGLTHPSSDNFWASIGVIENVLRGFKSPTTLGQVDPWTLQFFLLSLSVCLCLFVCLFLYISPLSLYLSLSISFCLSIFSLSAMM